MLWYLDIETNKLVDPDILTIQVAPMTWAGDMGALKVYKIWDYAKDGKSHSRAEAELLYDFVKDTNFLDKWEFVPVGYNLPFDLSVLAEKLKAYNFIGDEKHIFNRPYIDLHHFVVVENRGFKGSKLSQWSPKQKNGDYVVNMLKLGKVDEIEKYLQHEAYAFAEMFKHYARVLHEMPNPWGVGKEEM